MDMVGMVLGLLFVTPFAGLWVGGICLAIAWLSNGATILRLGALAAAVVWPLASYASATLSQKQAQHAGEVFAGLCRTKAMEKIHQRPAPVSKIFVEGVTRKEAPRALRAMDHEIWSRLVAERPGYREIHVLKPTQVDGRRSYAVHIRDDRKGSNRNSPPRPVDDSFARYGVRIELLTSRADNMVSEYQILAVDGQTDTVLARQLGYVYRSPEFAFAGLPLWQQQERMCLPIDPADFVRSALPPHPL
jgi:hypothetical protein